MIILWQLAKILRPKKMIIGVHLKKCGNKQQKISGINFLPSLDFVTFLFWSLL